MDGSMELTVRAPVSATVEEVEDVLADRKQWILETLYGVADQEDPPLDKEYLSGEKLLLNGRRYRLKVHEDDVAEPSLEFDGSRFTMRISADERTSVTRKRQAVVDWYLDRAREDLPTRASGYIEKLGLNDVDITVRELNRRWGEYQDGQVSLHWRLILAPRNIQDYVVAHELAHFRHDTHSDSFWNTVGTLVPDYQKRREWLRVNGGKLRV
ncbi:M48 family metallopeptidase [Halobacterium sp. KA-4]|nr:M48 family metallopeptidase [Halobacterium sp. KA-4]